MLTLSQEGVHRLATHVEVMIHDGYGQIHREQYPGQRLEGQAGRKAVMLIFLPTCLPLLQCRRRNRISWTWFSIRGAEANSGSLHITTIDHIHQGIPSRVTFNNTNIHSTNIHISIHTTLTFQYGRRSIDLLSEEYHTPQSKKHLGRSPNIRVHPIDWQGSTTCPIMLN